MLRESKEQKGIEIRSEKVQNIIGTDPPKFISWGITIIIIVFTVLFAFILNASYPYGHGETILNHFV
jgi:hypothetical protein